MATRRTKPPATPRKTGRPQLYTDELANEICRRIAQGESLVAICKTTGMPNYATVDRWLAQVNSGGKGTTFASGFGEKYARARERAADFLAAQCLTIADDARLDRVTRINAKTGETYEVIDYDNIQRSRLMFDARRWYASKLAPRKYGERVMQEVSGPDGGPVQTASIVAEVQSRLEAIRARMRGPAAPVTDIGSKRLP